MLNGIREKGLGVLNWTPEAEQYRIRLHCAARWLPEYVWPAVDDDSLLASLETAPAANERCTLAAGAESA